MWVAVVVASLVGVRAAAAQTGWQGEPLEPPPAARYGDAGTNHVGLALGLGGGSGGFAWAAGAEYGRFVIDGVAPTAEVDVSGGTRLATIASTMLALRLLPFRRGPIWPLLVPRAGRLFVADRDDLWGAGATLGIVIALGGRIGLQVAYDHLWLFPKAGCSAFSSGCTWQRWGLGLVVGL